LVMQGERGEGVAELVDRWLDNDLADVDDMNPRQTVPLAAALDDEGGPGLDLVPVRQSLLLTGTSGGGKSTLTTGLLERLAERDFQFVVMDPEGDYEGLGDAVAIGSATAPPRPEEVLEILRKTATSVAVNLLGVKLEDRPGYLAGLLPELLALRERTGRPQFVVVDEAHHMLPATWDPGATALPGGLKGFLFVTVRPEALSPRTLDCVDRVLAVGVEARAALAVFARAHGMADPEGADGVERGEVLTLAVSDPEPRRFKVMPGTTERRAWFRIRPFRVIPARLETDTCPLPCSDGSDAVWVIDQELPSCDAGVDDGVVAAPNRCAELVLAQVMPDVLHGVQLWRVGRQAQQRDVARHMQPPAGLVPACAVADQHGVRARRHIDADFLQVLVHRLGVDVGHDKGGPHGAVGADGAEQVGGDVPVVAHHKRARADRRPDISMGSFLADAGLVLEPDLDWRAGCAGEQRAPQQAGEVFLKACSAAASFFGWNGRGCSRVRRNWFSHLPIVLSCTVTAKRRATSARRSTHRQRTT